MYTWRPRCHTLWVASDPRHRLAVYGTLRPDHPNHHLIADIPGRWLRGHVRGRLVDQGWGAAFGSPGLVLDDSAGPVDVWVLESDDLQHHWARFDDFEGPGYRRARVTVTTTDGFVDADIYLLSDESC